MIASSGTATEKSFGAPCGAPSASDPRSRVLIFTASGTFRGARGNVLAREGGRVKVAVDGERLPLFFSPREVLLAEDPGENIGGAE